MRPRKSTDTRNAFKISKSKQTTQWVTELLRTISVGLLYTIPEQMFSKYLFYTHLLYTGTAPYRAKLDIEVS